MKKTIALVAGGFTGEDQISFKSAAIVGEHLDPSRYDVYKIIVSKEGWYHKSKDGDICPVDLNDFSIRVGDKAIKFDGIFNIIHGSPGEDGKLAGYWDMLGIPYTTCSALTAAVTMNKGYAKAIVQDIRGLHIARSLQLFHDQPENVSRIIRDLNLPLFVKPNDGGSSIGMSKVVNAKDINEALGKAFREGSQVLVEEFISGREFSIGVYRLEGKTVVLPATEIVSSREFFDFEAKYTPGVSEEITPGRMNAEEIARVNRIVAEIYETLDCRGAVRIDYFLENQSGDFYFVEVNTVPGQTETSLISQQVRAVGKTVREFYTELIEEMFWEFDKKG